MSIPEGMIRVSGPEITGLANEIGNLLESRYSETINTEIAAQLLICMGVDYLRHLTENDALVIQLISALIGQHMSKPPMGEVMKEQ